MANRAARSEFTSMVTWTQAVFAWLGTTCSIPGCTDSSEVPPDHIMPRGQGGLNDLANGWPLCPRHHMLKTINQLQIRRSWLRPEHLAWLDRKGWVRFDPKTGEPSGRGWRHFTGKAA